MKRPKAEAQVLIVHTKFRFPNTKKVIDHGNYRTSERLEKEELHSEKLALY